MCWCLRSNIVMGTLSYQIYPYNILKNIYLCVDINMLHQCVTSIFKQSSKKNKSWLQTRWCLRSNIVMGRFHIKYIQFQAWWDPIHKRWLIFELPWKLFTNLLVNIKIVKVYIYKKYKSIKIWNIKLLVKIDKRWLIFVDGEFSKQLLCVVSLSFLWGLQRRDIKEDGMNSFHREMFNFLVFLKYFWRKDISSIFRARQGQPGCWGR